MERMAGRSEVKGMMRRRGLTQMQADILCAAMEQAADEGLRGLKARRRAKAICEQKAGAIDWKSIFDKIGPIFQLLMQLIALFK